MPIGVDTTHLRAPKPVSMAPRMAQNPASHRNLAEDCQARFAPFDPLQGAHEHPIRNVEVALARKGVEPVVTLEVRLFREIRASEARKVRARHPRWIPKNQQWVGKPGEYFVPIRSEEVGPVHLGVRSRVGPSEETSGRRHMLRIDLQPQQPLRRRKRPNRSIQKGPCSARWLNHAGRTKATVDQKGTHSVRQCPRRLEVAKLGSDSGLGLGRHGSPHSQDAVDSAGFGDRATILQPPLQGV